MFIFGSFFAMSITKLSDLNVDLSVRHGSKMKSMQRKSLLKIIKETKKHYIRNISYANPYENVSIVFFLRTHFYLLSIISIKTNLLTIFFSSSFSLIGPCHLLGKPESTKFIFISIPPRADNLKFCSSVVFF